MNHEAIYYLVLFSVFVTFPAPCMSAVWSYHGDFGPEFWKTLVGTDCNGTRQSPIDIDTSSVVVSKYEPFVLDDYTSTNQYMDLDNNGHGVTVRLAEDVEHLYNLSGGGLPSTYVATQFHFHWGSVNSQGSEHTLNGRAFPGEMHMVHYDEKYNDLTEALTSDNPYAVAVLGSFLEIGPVNNEAFDSFLNYIGNISTWQSPRTSLGTGNLPSFSIRSVLPFDLSRFYRYNGSLTTPNCYQSVIWTVFDETTKISQEQLNKLRSVTGNENDANGDPQHIVDNFRTTNPLYDRTVYFNIPERVTGPSGTDPNTPEPTKECPMQKPSVPDEQNDDDRLGAVMTVVVIVLACVLAVVFIWASLMTVMFVTLRGKHDKLKGNSGKL